MQSGPSSSQRGAWRSVSAALGGWNYAMEAKCLPAQNIFENDRKMTLAGALQIHTGSFSADVN